MNYKDITIKQYEELLDVLKQEGDELDLQVALISIIFNIPEEDVLKSPIPKYKEYVRGINFLCKQPVPAKRQCPRKVKIQDREYDVITDVKDMVVGQYIDYETYASKEEYRKYKYMLSVFCIPKGHKYGEGYDIGDVIEDMDGLDVQSAIDICFFFRKKYLNLIRVSALYSEWTMRTQIRKTKDPKMKAQMKETRKKLKNLRVLIGNGIGGIM